TRRRRRRPERARHPRSPKGCARTRRARRAKLGSPWPPQSIAAGASARLAKRLDQLPLAHLRATGNAFRLRLLVELLVGAVLETPVPATAVAKRRRRAASPTRRARAAS